MRLAMGMAGVLAFMAVEHTVRNLSKTEADLRASEQRYKTIFENADVGLTQVRISDGKVLDANQYAAKILGYKNPEDLIAKYNPENHWVDTSIRDETFGEDGQNGEILDHEIEVRRLDGSLAFLRVSLTFFKEEDFLVAAAIDITEHRRAEDALRESEERYRSIFNNAQVGLITTRMKDGTLIDANKKMVELLGYDDVSELIEKFVARNAYADKELMKRVVEEGKRTGILENVEADFIRKDGSILQSRFSTRFFRERGTIETVVLDMGEQKKTHAMLVAALDEAERANRSKSDFLANMSHELRTPLNAILGFSQMIRDQALGENAAERYRGYAEDIYRSGSHLLALIGDILDLSRIEAGKTEINLTEFDLAAAVEECTALVQGRADEKLIALKTEIAPNGAQLLADERMIKQMLINLLTNSVKFTESGGHVVVRVNEGDAGKLMLTVQDDGIGIADEDIPAALSVFGQAGDVMTRSEEGTGLGLPLVASLAELHGGGVDIDSTPGEGTKVSIWLPENRWSIRAGVN